jgi:hypothetical protein
MALITVQRDQGVDKEELLNIAISNARGYIGVALALNFVYWIYYDARNYTPQEVYVTTYKACKQIVEDSKKYEHF